MASSLSHASQHRSQLTTPQKPKYKVGKAKPKAANFTDTSFQSRCQYSACYKLLVSYSDTG